MQKIIGLCLLLMSVQLSNAQQNSANTSTTSNTNAEKEIIDLSKKKWQWMSDKNVDSLTTLFDEKSMFVPSNNSK